MPSNFSAWFRVEKFIQSLQVSGRLEADGGMCAGLKHVQDGRFIANLTVCPKRGFAVQVGVELVTEKQLARAPFCGDAIFHEE